MIVLNINISRVITLIECTVGRPIDAYALSKYAEFQLFQIGCLNEIATKKKVSNEYVSFAGGEICSSVNIRHGFAPGILFS